MRRKGVENEPSNMNQMHVSEYVARKLLKNFLKSPSENNS